MDNTVRLATRTTMTTILDGAQEQAITLEVAPYQHHDYQIICSQEPVHPVTIFMRLHEHASCHVTYISSEGAALPSLHYTAELIGDYASLTTTMRVVTRDAQQAHITVQINQRAAHTKSVFDIKGVAYDASRMHFKGRVLLEQEAHYAQASMHHKHLVVGHTAQVHSQPELEARHHTVQCGHGSAISYIDDEQVFYACSRGLSEATAHALLIDSFLS